MVEHIYYPATYRAPFVRRLLAVSHIVILLFLGFLGRAQLDLSSSQIIWIFATVGLAIAIIWKFNESSSFITLHADRIEKKSWFSTNTWQRDEVASLSLYPFGEFRLVRKYNKGDYFFIPAGIKRDSTWSDWLRGVPEFGKYIGSAKEKRFAAAVIYVGFGILALIPALLSLVDFRDSSVVENAVSTQAKISTVQNGKNTASGWIDYSLPNGIRCHDWAELAPKGSVRPGDDIIVAVDRACGHPVSRKKPLHPWYYLSISLGIIIAMLYQLRKLKKDEIRTGNIV